MPRNSDRTTRVRVVRDGPVLIEGPVRIVAEDGTVTETDRFMAAVCTCRRSRTYPWCDTSHRARTRPRAAERRAGGDPRSRVDRQVQDGTAQDPGHGHNEQHTERDPRDSHDGRE